MAAQKRSAKVAPGIFHDSDIQYFGETVVIWNLGDFMKVTKWREDAIRRSRRNEDNMVSGCEKKKREDGESRNKVGLKEIKCMGREKKFKSLCDQLYQKSLSK